MKEANEEVRKGRYEKLSLEEERLVLEAVGKSLPMKVAADYAGVEWLRLERLMVKDKALKKMLDMAIAREQGRVMDLLKSKGGDVKALAFMLERVYGLSAVEAKATRKDKVAVAGMTITPAVLRALAGGDEKIVVRN